MTPLTKEEQLAIVSAFSQLQGALNRNEDPSLALYTFHNAYRGDGRAHVDFYSLEGFRDADGPARMRWLGRLRDILVDEIPPDVWTEYYHRPDLK